MTESDAEPVHVDQHCTGLPRSGSAVVETMSCAVSLLSLPTVVAVFRRAWAMHGLASVTSGPFSWT